MDPILFAFIFPLKSGVSFYWLIEKKVSCRISSIISFLEDLDYFLFAYIYGGAAPNYAPLLLLLVLLFVGPGVFSNLN